MKPRSPGTPTRASGCSDELVQFRDGERKPTELLPTEELNSQKLNDLKTALGDMKIVGVLRKPTGLGADLKAGADFMNNEESQTSLMNRGFYLADMGGDAPEIRAANGEVLVGLKDGVEYVLRFGEIARASDSKQDRKARSIATCSSPRGWTKSKFPPLQLDPLPGGEDSPRPPRNAAAARQPAGR